MESPSKRRLSPCLLVKAPPIETLDDEALAALARRLPRIGLGGNPRPASQSRPWRMAKAVASARPRASIFR